MVKVKDSTSCPGYRLICLVGMDGSGKSTLARSVIRACSEHGTDFRYVHGLMQGLLSRPLMALARCLFARGTSRESDYGGFVAAKRHSVSRRPTLFRLYRLVVFLDYIPQVVWKIVFPLALGKRVILDRYVYDTAINLELNSSYSPERVRRTLELFFRVFPRPDLTFLVDVPEEVAFSRKDDVPDIRHLQERRGLYHRMAHAYNITVLDGRLSLEVLTDRVVEAIRSGVESR
jgi:thymidylate kinase